MNKSKVILTAVIASIISVSAMANQLTGTVNFTGTLIAAPCNITAGTKDIQIDFGDISMGHESMDQIKSAKISLENCNFADYSKLPKQVSRAVVEFKGTSDQDKPELLAVRGAASGIGIRLLDSLKNDLDIRTGVIAAAVNSATTNNIDINFNIKIELTGKELTYGNFTSTATYEIAYK